jgi:catechol 2,3-dioxygenase-like lactoylglutathione lyase family enzyme
MAGSAVVTVRRIVTNIATHDPAIARRFYGEVLGLDVLMDMGWIVTYGAPSKAIVQISIATQGGSDTSVPDISIEVENVDEVLERVMQAGFTVEYGPVDEPWGVRRFYVRDPFGKLVNVLSHR